MTFLKFAYFYCKTCQINVNQDSRVYLLGNINMQESFRCQQSFKEFFIHSEIKSVKYILRDLRNKLFKFQRMKRLNVFNISV